MSTICSCQRTNHPLKLVVLTGGPGAGKTAVLEIARRNFCQHVSILPEAASIVFGGGFWRRESLAAKQAAQRAIFHIQRELERLVEEEHLSAVALCDRGTIDGLAYWPSDESLYWKELGTSKEIELARYSAVIHLRTPSMEFGYNNVNPVRIESAKQAIEIDEKIAKAWDGHPNRIFIESHSEFMEKAESAISLVKNELPECCRKHHVQEFKKR